MAFLLDTNTCIQAMRGNLSVRRAMASRPPTEIAVSSITCYELHTGVEKCADQHRERAKVATLLSTVKQFAFDQSAADASARFRADLERRGQMIGPYDILIAGHASALGCVLVTGNTDEFSRIPQLKLENWEAESPVG